MATTQDSAVAPIDPSVAPEPLSVADSGDNSEGGKVKMMVTLLKRALGVKDIAAMRISLPASLMEPQPNLEYWMYLDRPDLFAAINDSEDPFERMLAVLRFSFTKELKFVHGKVVKPYNSVLGEHFRAHWTVKPVEYPSDPTEPPVVQSYTAASAPSVPASETSSLRSGISKTAKSSAASGKSPLLTAKEGDKLKRALSDDASKLSLGENALNGSDSVRVVYLTEQVSHHPPISSWAAAVPSKGIEAAGVDQLSAKVNPTLSIRVGPGDQNKGIFVRLTSGPGAGEKYQITHPVAIVTGILRAAPYATIGESSIITRTSPNAQQHLRAIVEYKDESWIGSARFLLEGVIHEYDPEDDEHESWTKVRQVPQSKVIATFEGSWRKRIYWKRAGESTKHLLVDLSSILPVPKTVRPLSEQIPYESRKLWQTVTEYLNEKNYNEATRHKQIIEQAQRDLAAERKRTGEAFVPTYFEEDISDGEPKLTEAGRKVMEEEANSSS